MLGFCGADFSVIEIEESDVKSFAMFRRSNTHFSPFSKPSLGSAASSPFKAIRYVMAIMVTNSFRSLMLDRKIKYMFTR